MTTGFFSRTRNDLPTPATAHPPEGLTLMPSAGNRVPEATTAPQIGDNGEWDIVPGVLKVKWAVGSDNADIGVYLYNWSIDTLTGRLELHTGTAETSDQLDVMGLIKGDIAIQSGLKPLRLDVIGDLEVFGTKIRAFDWPLYR